MHVFQSQQEESKRLAEEKEKAETLREQEDRDRKEREVSYNLLLWIVFQLNTLNGMLTTSYPFFYMVIPNFNFFISS